MKNDQKRPSSMEETYEIGLLKTETTHF